MREAEPVEAGLFVQAEQMLVEVLGRVRPADRDVMLPPLPPEAPQTMTMAQAVERQVRDDTALATGLGGAPPEPGSGVPGAARAACAAVRAASGTDPAVRDELLRAVVARSLLAHYVAAYLGSTACPLPEELARPLWELTAPDAERWRALGHFRDPLPLPPHVSWRDRFLLTAGHPAHPLGH